ncbi:hypothetical protein [Streptomyces sp. NPDC017890]|uniref:hypothetical protein n=1 Tax=Streptomyces sp. NPDC017890 TaxID=3365015 RepID=UPI0037927692
MTSSKPLRIAVLGTHSTDRTTLLKRIKTELRGHGITVARTGRLGKRAAAAGLPKMQHHTVQSTEWIMTQGILDETTAAVQGAEVVLIDQHRPAPAVTNQVKLVRGVVRRGMPCLADRTSGSDRSWPMGEPCALACPERASVRSEGTTPS